MMTNRMVFLLTALLIYSNISFAREAQLAGMSDKAGAPTAAATPSPQKDGKKAKMAAVPETPKDKENKRKCRRLGGTWQLGHCNVG